ncbi:MAG TPA: sugar ABC transporter permease [Acetobacteraceae bacterium]|nr:sugar ABC transporter permease [Acetobacteraceae bacterium]
MRRQEGIFFAATVFPAIAVIGFVIVAPLLISIFYSFTDLSLIEGTDAFTGLANYRHLLADPTFYQSLWNTLMLGVVPVVGAFFVGFGQALLLNEAVAARSLLRGLTLLPWVIPQIVVSFLFLFMYNSSVGVVNVLLHDLGLIHHFVPWLALPGTAPPAVAIAYVWTEAPFFMLMLLAGLQTIPPEIVEAAIVDGAGWWQRLRLVVLPGLRRIIAISTILMVIWNFNNFTIIWPLTQGGPVNATLTFAVWVYRQAFQNFDLGSASTIGVAWLILLLVVTFFYLRLMGGDEGAA